MYVCMYGQSDGMVIKLEEPVNCTRPHFKHPDWVHEMTITAYQELCGQYISMYLDQ